MNFLSLKNGTAHSISRTSGFAGTETWEEIDLVARQQFRASPAVLARGMLAMMRYTAIETLSSIQISTIVVAGDRDTITKPVASELIHEGISRAELRVLAPAKHMGFIEHHREYAAVVRDFVTRVVVSSVSIVS